MKSIYEIEWTEHALSELNETFDYLNTNWTEKEKKKLALKIEKTLHLISNNPEIFPKSFRCENVRKVVVTKHNTLFYREKKGRIEILSFFSNFKNPTKSIF